MHGVSWSVVLALLAALCCVLPCSSLQLGANLNQLGPYSNLWPFADLLAQRVDETKSGWVAGPDLTVADLCLYGHLLHLVREGNFDYVPATYFDAWPQLSSLEARVKAHPIFVAYLASRAPAGK